MARRRFPGAGNNGRGRPEAAVRGEATRRSDTTERADADEDEMNTSHPRRISRKAAEELLQGGSPPAAIPEPLARLLATAAAPPRPGELGREEMAVAAFSAEHLELIPASQEGQMITSSLAKFLTTKVAALALAITTTGGIALAATVHSMHSGGHVRTGTSSQAPAAGNAGAASHTSGHVAAKTPAAKTGALAAGSANGSASSLCLALATQVHSIITDQPSTGSQRLPAGG